MSFSKNKNLTETEILEIFDSEFGRIIEKSKDVSARLVKLEFLIPEFYFNHMGKFLEKFFGKDPFELNQDDLETVFINGKSIKRIKLNRRPISYLSIFRFLLLCHQSLESIKDDVSVILHHYKDDFSKTEGMVNKDEFQKVQVAGRLFKKYNPTVHTLYLKLIKHINQTLEDAKLNQGEEGFVNIRKINGLDYLAALFDPEYKTLISNLTFMLAVAKEIKLERNKIEKEK
ncbi:MAG: hypothetical protein KDK36_17750 [Leptospiraceae bacterium]|nr:hypothetical protein [Leptospiraceae bacterium]